MPIAVSTITQTGQISIPKIIRDILGVEPHDQVQFVSDGERVQILPVPKDPLSLGTPEEFWSRIELSEAQYQTDEIRHAQDVSEDLRAKYGL